MVSKPGEGAPSQSGRVRHSAEAVCGSRREGEDIASLQVAQSCLHTLTHITQCTWKYCNPSCKLWRQEILRHCKAENWRRTPTTLNFLEERLRKFRYRKERPKLVTRFAPIFTPMFSTLRSPLEEGYRMVEMQSDRASRLSSTEYFLPPFQWQTQSQ